MLLAVGVNAGAQQLKEKVPLIGFVTTGSKEANRPVIEPLRQNLRELGYVEGKTISLEYRFADGQLQRLPALIEELSQLKIDILLANSGTVARAAKKSNVTIPIIVMNMGSLTGLADSLARPGGNVTGLTHISIELLGKRLELLKEAVPKITRFGFLDDTNTLGYRAVEKDTMAAVKTLGIQLRVLPIKESFDTQLNSAFETMVKERIGAFSTEATPLISFYRKQIIALAEKNRLPAIYSDDRWPNAGGLMSYGANRIDTVRRIAAYIDKILKDRKPADLPIEQPMKFDFVVNLKTAKQLGLEIPQWTLMKADRVIK
jgi:putative ABC transport system substrate-binding protein